jgi:surfeit locus 1 family protein
VRRSAPASPSLLWPGSFALLAFASLVALGTWQLQRLHWKEGLIRAVSERATVPALPLPPEAEWPRLDRDALEYRHVAATGRFRHEDEIRVFTDLPSPKGPAGGSGFWVMTPLALPDGSTIIVNRGFVPHDRADPGTRLQGQTEGPVTIAGLARWSEDRNPFTPADNAAKGEWFTRDPLAIAAAAGIGRVAPFFIDAEASPPGGLPQGGETRLVFPNRHLEYALTWYGLAGSLVGVFAVFAWRRRRSSGDPRLVSPGSRD